MFENKVKINNKTGLHARPASDLTNLCQKFESDIKIITEEGEINPKSIISILAGGVYQGMEVTLLVEGADEKEAGEAIVELIRNLTD
ncbi:MAG: Phosphocarrier protein of system [Herbinix sp.]|jgi:phosphocarrier protein|nr:Phosphocarrier protein of system [Herbinix sp.]